MANTLLTPDIITRELLYRVENNMVMAKKVRKDLNPVQYKELKTGGSIRVRKPLRAVATDGATITSKLDLEEADVEFNVNIRKHVAFDIPTQDYTLKIQDFGERYLKPVGEVLANEVDTALMGLYSDIANHVGTPGTTPANFKAIGRAGARLTNIGIPKSGRVMAINPTASLEVADSFVSKPNETKVKKALEEAMIGRAAGFDTMETQNIRTHTQGDWAGTPLVKGASQSVTYVAAEAGTLEDEMPLIVDGFTTATAALKKGDVFTIAGVYAVNLITKQPQPYLQPFVVKADVAAVANTATMQISPAIITSGAYQTVDVGPADGAVITALSGSTTGANYAQNIGFHPDAFGLYMADLYMPEGAAWKSRARMDGVSVRLIKEYNITTDVETLRADILFGVKTLDRNFACRLAGETAG